MTLLIYIIKTILVSGILFGYYTLFLRNRKIHQFNRLFLLSIPVLSLLIPALHFSLPSNWFRNDSGQAIRLLGVGQGRWEEAVTIYGGQKSTHLFNGPFLISILCIGVSLCLFIRLWMTIRFLQRLPKNKPSLPLPEATIYFISAKGTPFSFFRNIFWGEDQEINSEPAQQILRHEIYHAVNKHSADILWIEFLTVFFWINPFLFLIHRELRAIHEYTADEYASAETDRYSYATLLLQNATRNKLPLTHPFFKTHIKRRIAMITHAHKNRKSLLARLLIIPTIIALVCLFSFKSEKRYTLTGPETIRVIIDPGHGGDFEGAYANGIYEKDFTLTLSKKIKSLAKEYHVEVILTREKDENIGDGTLRSSLMNRVEMAGKQNASLFISIHANMKEDKTQTENSGISIYIPKTESKFHNASVKLGSVITEYLKTDYTITPELKQSETGVAVLDKTTVPAILIECGYLDNKTDVDFLQNEKNQEKIARDILEGIRKYSIDPVTYQNNQKVAVVAVSEHAVNDTTPDPVFKKVEVEAEYPGGQKGWMSYLSKHMSYPDSAVNKEVQGTVVVEFIVNKDGSLSDMKVVSGPELLRSESLRVLKESGNWIPARQNGEVVASYHKQPFNYKLEVK